MKAQFAKSIRLIGLVEALAALAGLFFLLGLLGRRHWLLDLCSHFRAQYAAGLLLCGFGLLLAGRRRSGAVSLGGGLLLGLSFLPWQAVSQPAAVKPWKVITYNVNTGNEQCRAVREYLEKEDADVVLLVEVSDFWLGELASLQARYPHRSEVARDDNFGIALWSKHPFRKESVRHSGPYHIPWIEVEMDMAGQPVRLVGLHTLPPMTAQNSSFRNQQLMEAAALLNDHPGILLGDLNLTPYSLWFAEVLKRGRLTDTSAWSGFSPTWSRNSPLTTLPLVRWCGKRSQWEPIFS